MSNASNTDDLAELRDEDIHTLFDVVERASGLSEAHFGRGLFEAFDAIVAEYSIGPEKQQQYFKFLVRMVAGRADTDTLFSRFKSLLQVEGISIVLADEETSIGDITRHGSSAGSAAHDDEAKVAGASQMSPRPSFGSAYEQGSWKTGEDLNNHATLAIDRPASRASDPAVPYGLSKPGARRVSSLFGDRGRVNTRAVSDNIYHQLRPRSGSASSTVSIVVGRRAESDTGITSRARSSSRDGRVPLAPIGQISLFHPSDTQLLADVDTFMYHRNIRLLRRVIWQWRDLARVRIHKLHSLDERAEIFEERQSARKASRLFLQLVQRVRRDRELDEVFAERERISERNYEVHLMEKALDHWTNYAQDHIKNTQLARRHILRRRYFTAWVGVTTLNDLKVRQFRLRKYFGIWRTACSAKDAAEYLAADHYESTLQARALKKLNLTCKVRVWGYRANERLRVTYFHRWLQIHRIRRDMVDTADRVWKQYQQRKILEHLKDRLAAMKVTRQRADDFRLRSLASRSLTTLATQTKLAAPFRQASGLVDSRLVLSALRAWSLRAQQSLQAANVDRLRVLRNAMTSWNDQLRYTWLVRRLDDRVAVEALYKITVASKASRFIRIRDQKLLWQCLCCLVTYTRDHSVRLDQAASALGLVQERLCLKRAWNMFRATYNSRRYDEAKAGQQYRTRRVPDTFQDWRVQAQRVQTLQEQAMAARFYVLTTNALKRWRAATEHSQKLRRREAYAAVRRRCKMNLVRQALGLWRAKTEKMRRMEQQAGEKAEDASFKICLSTFQSWRDRSAQVSVFSLQAETYRSQVLLRTAWARLVTQHKYLRQMDAKVQPYKAELAAMSAQKAFTKLGWRLFQLRRLEQNAFALKEKHWHSHVKSMLRFWADQAARLRLSKADADGGRFDLGDDDDDDDEDEDGEGDSPARFGAGGGYDGHVPSDASMLRAEEWTALDESALRAGSRKARLNLDLIPAGSTAEVEGIIESTPLPGYLRTPSKRSAARSKARERLVAADGSRGALGTPGEAVGDVSLLARARARTAPAGRSRGRGFSSSRPASVTPFVRKLRAQGISARGSGSAGGSREARSMGRGRGGVLLSAGRGQGNANFAGFEDIPEDDGSREVP